MVALAFASALGCSGSGIPEDRFCADHAEIECRTLAGWCGFTAAACQAARQTACTMRVQAQRSGSRPYDSQAAAACISALAQLYRTQPIAIASLRAAEATCERVYHGNNAVGEGCRTAVDCQRGLICRGRCLREVQVPADGSCDQPGATCAAGYYCALGGPSGMRTCRPALAVGQACGAQPPCQDHLRCQDMVCTSRLPLGAACDRDLDCAPPSAYCNPYTGLCADQLSFAPGSVSCLVQAGTPVTADAAPADRRSTPDADLAVADDAGDLADVGDGVQAGDGASD